MPRISKKERLRRQRISKGLKRYYKRVHFLEKVSGISFFEARALYKGERKRGERLERRERKILKPKAIFDGDRYAFMIKDQLHDELKEAVEKTEGRKVKAEIEIQRIREDRTIESEKIKQIEFYGSDDENEFWSNYHEAVRDEVEKESDKHKYESGVIHILRLI